MIEPDTGPVGRTCLTLLNTPNDGLTPPLPPNSAALQDNVTQLVGCTPMVYLNKVNDGTVAEIAAKLEIMVGGGGRVQARP